MLYTNFNMANIPFLVIFIYIIVEILKMTCIKDDKHRMVLPLICAVIGAILAVVLYGFFPEAIGATNFFEAATMGASSGLAATGCNQLYKQVRAFYEGTDNVEEEKKKKEKEEKEKEQEKLNSMKELENAINGVSENDDSEAVG